ncbi:phosphoglycolate phosphatase [Thalassobius vesicularis]|uniref:Phosphoglycolate phosphatase n=2 Tax=Thalassobius vesicularis TaxID=1294297 RepID=A0A4S3M8I7_9RHOB|nr:phosphoglycolate phosphatase [Thalassobius vesicularis]THD73873.1 phosphoglycolate phosphatase [Thalassobius vesicularis]
MPMAIVVFDLDGTLIDSAPDIRAAANKMLCEQGIAGLDLPTIISFIGNGLPKLVERVMQRTGLDMSRHSELTAVTLAHYNAATTDLTRPYPGVVQALEALSAAGHVLAMCTNKPEEPARSILRDLRIERFFNGVVGGDTLAVKKPDPEPLLHIIRHLGEGPALYVGDSEVDAETAVRAGVRFALFTEGYRKSPVEAIPHQHQFSDFTTLPGLVERALREEQTC